MPADVTKAVEELRERAAELRSELSRIEAALGALQSAGPIYAAEPERPRRGRPPNDGSDFLVEVPKGKRELSAEGRAAIGAAAKKRWAKYRREQKSKK